MSDSGCHCPFLNRSDQRCAEFFNLDHLQHAFKFCFDRYHTCPVYAQVLAERQGRRAFAAAQRQTLEPAETQQEEVSTRAGGRQSLVQVSIPARFAKRQSAAA